MRVCLDEWFINLSSVPKRRTKEIIYITCFKKTKITANARRVIIAFSTGKVSGSTHKLHANISNDVISKVEIIYLL